MKRLVLMLALMTVLFVPAVASAYNNVIGWPLPTGAGEVDTWSLKEGGTPTNPEDWTFVGAGSTTANARCWASGYADGECNRQRWRIDVTHHASVAQWIKYELDATRWDWRIRKPGTYAADCIKFTVWSNNAVRILYSGFEDLQYKGQGGIKQTIDTYYTYGQNWNEALTHGWVSAADLNDDDDVIEDSEVLHSESGWWTKLWNMIVVERCNSSCEYEDKAVITLVPTNMKHWIDRETGEFAESQV